MSKVDEHENLHAYENKASDQPDDVHGYNTELNSFEVFRIIKFAEKILRAVLLVVKAVFVGIKNTATIAPISIMNFHNQNLKHVTQSLLTEF